MSDLYDEPPCVDEPNLVECEHCGGTFDKLDPDDENICPGCMGKIEKCYNCDERLWSDDGHVVDAAGRHFCSDGCQNEFLRDVTALKAGGAE